MKTFIKNFLLGICIGTTIFVYSIILGSILIGDITPDMFGEYALYFVTTIWLAIFIGLGLTFAENNQNMETEKRKKILKASISIISTLILLSIISLIICIVIKYILGAVISILFVISLLFWLVGAKMNYKIINDKQTD